MNLDHAIATTDLVVEHSTPRGVVRALDHAGFVIDGGTSTAIMGPSGCGKSTLLGLLAGLATPTYGSVTIGSTTLSDLDERARVRFRRRAVGMVYQADNLLPHLTVEENVGLQVAICRRDRLGHHVDEPARLLDRLGLGALAQRLPDQLSGGQRQRVAIARAIVHQPVVILADEPTGALDGVNARAVVELLLEVQSGSGATMVVVTHDPHVAAAMGRTMYLDRPRQPAPAAISSGSRIGARSDRGWSDAG